MAAPEGANAPGKDGVSGTGARNSVPLGPGTRRAEAALKSGPHRELFERLKGEIEGDVLFDAFSRGRYATDASIYQIMPIGVVIPKTFADVEAALR